MRVLVTGATGFTGGHLVRALVGRPGYRVRALVRDPRRGAALSPFGVELVVGDITDRRAVGAAVAGMDIVFNIAAVYREAGLPAATYRAVNAEAPGWIVEEAAAAGVGRVVHCSTVGVHGDIEHPPANEDAPLRPGDLYQRTKLDGERGALAASRRLALPLTVVRPTGIYGPGDRRLLKLFRNVVRRRPLLGTGQIYYHLTYIDDLVEGFRLAGEAPAAANRTYILAGGEVTTLNELVGLIARLAGTKASGLHLPVWPVWLAGAACEAVCAPFGIEPPLFRRRVEFFTKSRAFDITRARQEIGYAPAVGLAEGLSRTLEWYRLQGWL